MQSSTLQRRNADVRSGDGKIVSAVVPVVNDVLVRSSCRSLGFRRTGLAHPWKGEAESKVIVHDAAILAVGDTSTAQSMNPTLTVVAFEGMLTRRDDLKADLAVSTTSGQLHR